MVIPYEIGNPVRSFVLVPGTGTDKTAKALCLDLARSSSVAGAVPVQSSVPCGISVDSLKPSKQEEKEESQDNSGSQAENGEGRQVVAAAQPAPDTQQVSGDGQGARVSAGTKRSIEADTSDSEENKAKIRRTDDGGGSDSETENSEVAELRRRCEALQRENANLNRRLAMFHDLFRSKERLTSFVRFLESSK